ncbi:MAG TPA: hypothetical protein VKA70_09910 [Blastocatellia bacterium]|nr:hypothetical protein [Blastocatellia bacterium]
MSELEIRTRDDKTSFLPGEVLEGQVSWATESAPELIELRLFWRTQGKGTRDVSVVQSILFENPRWQGTRDFRFQLPDGPYSFSGKLISLIWALELIVTSTNETERLDILVSPTGSEIMLPGGTHALPLSGT